jgi:hypothetical protein
VHLPAGYRRARQYDWRSCSSNPPALEAEDLHHGQAVAAADRLVAVLAADIRSTVDRILALQADARFTGHVDQAQVLYAGHSLGGAASLEGCRTDPRCAGAVDLDGTQFGRSRVPASTSR